MNASETSPNVVDNSGDEDETTSGRFRAFRGSIETS